MEISSINYFALLVLAGVAAFFLVILKSSNNMLRLASWLEARARAQEEIHAALSQIQERQRIYQRRREVSLLKQQESDMELREIARG